MRTHTRNLLASALTCLTFTIFAAPSAWAAPQRSIEVDAQAELEGNPDVVDLRFDVSVLRKTPKAAVRELRTRERAIVSILTKAGLPLKQIRLSHIRLYQQTEYKRGSMFKGRSKRVIVGYKASKTFIACIQNISKLAHFVETLASSKVTSFSTTFRSTKITLHKKTLREMAVKAAKEKAGELAKHAGVKLDLVKSIKEVTQYRGYSRSNAFGYSVRRSRGSSVSPDAIKLTLGIRMAFTIK